MKAAGPALGIWALSLVFAGTARAAQDAPAPATFEKAVASSVAQSAAPRTDGVVTGKIVDPTGVGVAGATVKLSRGDGAASVQETISDGDGRFVFARAEAGPVHLTVTSSGFVAREYSGIVQSGQSLEVPQITLTLASVNTEVRVVPPQVIAEEQIKEEEKQKALGFIPNYYVTYIPDAVALNPRQKFQLAWKSLVDPVTFGLTGAVAGLEQATNQFSGYGQGADGYAKRYGAAYADAAISTMIGGAILPSLFKQDPRYFYKGTGTRKSRLMYALANSVICKGDNGRWQANYSGILGGFAAAGISNAYYPPKDRGADLVVENVLIGIGATAAANVLQEFLIRKLTPNLPSHDPNNSGGAGGSGKTRSLVGRAFGTLGSMMREGD